MDIYYVDISGDKVTEAINLGLDDKLSIMNLFRIHIMIQFYSIPQIKLIREGSLIFILLLKRSLTVGQQTL